MTLRNFTVQSSSVIRLSVLAVSAVLLVTALSLFVPSSGQAQAVNPHWGQITPQPASVSFANLSACTSEFFRADAEGVKTSLSAEGAPAVNLGQLNVNGVQIEFAPTGSCRIVIELKARQ